MGGMRWRMGLRGAHFGGSGRRLGLCRHFDLFVLVFLFALRVGNFAGWRSGFERLLLLAWRAGFRPGGRLTFFCFAKRK